MREGQAELIITPRETCPAGGSDAERPQGFDMH